MGGSAGEVLVVRQGGDDPSPGLAAALRAHGLQACPVSAGDRPADLNGYRGLVVAAGAEGAASHLWEQAGAAGLPRLRLSGTAGPQDVAAFARSAACSAAYRSARGTREFFAPRAASWEEKFPDDGPAFAEAVGELALTPGATALDAGCGTGRALPLLRAAVGAEGHVIGVDLTPEMVRSALARGRGAHGRLLVADVARLPLPGAAVDAVLAAGLISHLPDPAAALTELARVTVTGGRLALFHPVGRTILAARHGRAPSPADLRAEHNLRPLLDRTGWTLTAFHDTDDRYLGLTVRR
ncbi:hypothetical protein Misp01_23320 [Microtetraspora sp. NBRC 13810]|uniref:class I SAM-dependent methyltransferase n=1 Tax=Microtetraspora sp. NBRC 13810 TaxID=3030990 RepID=UPI0024A2FDDD|nr:methyltransferase domain-containing protein [Microtetraspora sp. NBRC 13810]GLW07202.1 hypothetical protein Misp01_23320 [Microtetraspora sp. NBRC 13810]